MAIRLSFEQIKLSLKYSNWNECPSLRRWGCDILKRLWSASVSTSNGRERHFFTINRWCNIYNLWLDCSKNLQWPSRLWDGWSQRSFATTQLFWMVTKKKKNFNTIQILKWILNLMRVTSVSLLTKVYCTWHRGFTNLYEVKGRTGWLVQNQTAIRTVCNSPYKCSFKNKKYHIHNHAC